MLRAILVLASFASTVDAFAGRAVLLPKFALGSRAISQGTRSVRTSALRMNSELSSISTARSGTHRSKPALNKFTFSYDFNNVPFQKGMEHIHSPEHISTTHKMGAPFFELLKVLPPKLSESKASITYYCSTMLMKNMYIRMYTSAPNVSNLLFFNKSGKALYGVTLTVLPLHGFASHKLRIDINLFTSKIPKFMITALMPIFLFINGLEDTLAFHREGEMQDHPFFAEYRKIVATNFNKRLMDLNSEVFQKYSS